MEGGNLTAFACMCMTPGGSVSGHLSSPRRTPTQKGSAQFVFISGMSVPNREHFKGALTKF